MLHLLASAALAAPGYLRTPDLHDDTVVFSAEGDLWTASAAGGPATRITRAPGTEVYPSFSPDGTQVAYEDRPGYEDQWRKRHTSPVTRDVWVWNRTDRTHTRLACGACRCSQRYTPCQVPRAQLPSITGKFRSGCVSMLRTCADISSGPSAVCV